MSWRIEVKAYMLAVGEGTVFDNDWLCATLWIGTAQRKLSHMLVEELERIVLWLELVRDCKPVRDLEMVDADFKFKLIRRGHIPFVKVIYGNNPQKRLVADQWTTPEAMESCLTMLNELTSQWPCRCGRPHDLELWPEVDRSTFEYPGLAKHEAEVGTTSNRSA